MTEEQANWLLAAAGEGPHSLLGSTIDPNYFLSLHVDRYSVEVLRESLLLLMGAQDIDSESKGTARGLLELVNDWLDAGGRYLDES
ncbi:hypothetical protein [Actinomadura craniellae]|uniref:hypothetical protein n=1 Tax=Actinomadura craniellae TaxID=2231787 RepID=UPI0011BF528D|nr:hypothetical protein [Actinomadura craniellae]